MPLSPRRVPTLPMTPEYRGWKNQRRRGGPVDPVIIQGTSRGCRAGTGRRRLSGFLWWRNGPAKDDVGIPFGPGAAGGHLIPRSPASWGVDELSPRSGWGRQTLEQATVRGFFRTFHLLPRNSTSTRLIRPRINCMRIGRSFPPDSCRGPEIGNPRRRERQIDHVPEFSPGEPRSACWTTWPPRPAGPRCVGPRWG